VSPTISDTITEDKIMRSILLSSIIGLIVAGCSDIAGNGAGVPPPPPPPAAPVATIRAATTASGDGQSGTVATTLPLPLRVVVDSDGAPRAGVTVTWQAYAGALEPQSSVTDAEGLATAMWSLDTVSGAKLAFAGVIGASGSPVSFRATALAGPATTIEKQDGDSQTVASNRQFLPLRARLADRYDNGVVGQTTTWTVESGTLVILSNTGVTDGIGVSNAVVGRTQRTPGTGVVRVALNGATPAVDFALAVGPPEAFVVVDNQGSSAFISAQNNTSPAVDTLPVGQTMAFPCLNFDYDQHRLVSVGEPSFRSRDFPYGCQSEPVSVAFIAPGTYQYADFYHPAAIGTIVVQ
jgi:hypothetical protein